MQNRILILCNSSNGLYNFRRELITELLKENNVIASMPDKEKAQELHEIGCKIRYTDIDRRSINPIKDFKLMVKYIRLLRGLKPDMVITYTIKPNIYGGFLCGLLKIPFAVNITGLGTTFQNNGILRALVTIMYKMGLKRAKVVFFENEENRNIFIDEKIVKEEKTCLLNGAGVNLERFQLEEYPMDTEVTRFLFIGRVMKEKGINELFYAMKKLQEDGYNAQLDILGGFEENYESIIKECEEQGWLHYHGYQKDVRPFIKNAHCFVLPSWHEGMANTNLECAASGRPVITSNIHGCMESVIDGVSGYTAEKQNQEDLYTKMKKIIELSAEDRKRMGLEGRRHMEEVFDKRKVVSDTVEALFGNN